MQIVPINEFNLSGTINKITISKMSYKFPKIISRPEKRQVSRRKITWSA